MPDEDVPAPDHAVPRPLGLRVAGILNEWAYARAAEDLADIDVPEYAQVIRTMSAEMCRIASHELALATFALDVFGDFTADFQYGIRDPKTSRTC